MTETNKENGNKLWLYALLGTGLGAPLGLLTYITTGFNGTIFGVK